jgi:hypothetical protein
MIDELFVNGMSLDEMSADKLFIFTDDMSVNGMSLDETSVGGMSVDETSVD